MKATKFILILFAIIFTLSSCVENQFDKDMEIIENYITSHNLDKYGISVNDNGLHHIIIEEGAGLLPSATDSVTITFTLQLTNDVVVNDQNSVTPCTVYLPDLVYGLQMGITQMKSGENAMLLVPSNLGYGSYGFGNIEPNSVLVYDISLISFKANN